MTRREMNPRDPSQLWTLEDVARWLQLTPEGARWLVRQGALAVFKGTPSGIALFRPSDVVALQQRRLQDLVNGRRLARRASAQYGLPFWGAEPAAVAARKPIPWPRVVMLKAKTPRGTSQVKPGGMVKDSARIA